MYKYKNISDQDLVVCNIGVVKSQEIIESEVIINNPNLELQIKESRKKGVEQ